MNALELTAKCLELLGITTDVLVEQEAQDIERLENEPPDGVLVQYDAYTKEDINEG